MQPKRTEYIQQAVTGLLYRFRYCASGWEDHQSDTCLRITARTVSNHVGLSELSGQADSGVQAGVSI